MTILTMYRWKISKRLSYKRINPVDHEYVEKVLEIIDQMNKRQVNNG